MGEAGDELTVPDIALNPAESSRTNLQEPMKITVIRYNQDGVTSREVVDLNQTELDPPDEGTTWINVAGPVTRELLQSLERLYGFHPLALEDVQRQNQRSKVDLYDQHLFATIYALDATREHSRQISIFCRQNLVVTLLSYENGLFAPLREMVHTAQSNLRKSGSDFLLYAICDRIIDSYFPGLEAISKELDQLEDQIFTITRQDIAEQLHRLRVTMVDLETIVLGAQEVIESLRAGSNSYLQPQTLLYLRDCYDHTLQQLHSIDSYRQIAASILEAYLSLANNEMNEVIKVLTVISTIFIPLTFITGVYGMNFAFMPELSHPAGYAVAWILMIGIATGMLIFFHRKKWL